MNKKSRDTLRDIMLSYRQIRDKLKATEEKLNELDAKLGRLESDEHFNLDNTPDNLKNSLTYDERADKADLLTDIWASATTITSDCNDLISKIEDLLNDADDVIS